MGMFAYVRFTDPCVFCDHAVDEWQTKDVAELYLQTVTPEQIGNGEMYGVCPACGTGQTRYVYPVAVRVSRERE
jgi:hypothetical protein